MKFDIKDAMKKPTMEGKNFYIEEMDQLADELLEGLALKDHLQVALTKNSSEGYLHKISEEYLRMLDSSGAIQGGVHIEESNESVSGSGMVNSIESASKGVNSIEPTVECKGSIPGDWSELKAPKVDLKPLPKGLKYAFLGTNSTYPVIVNDELEPDQLHALLTELRKYRKAIGYTLDDIKGILPDLCTHMIHLDDETKSSIEPQRRLNPNRKEVVKKEIIKLLDAGIIYPISDSTWISPVHCVPKKGGDNCNKK